MTEAEWLTPDDNPLAKWHAAEGSSRWTDRTLRLFVTAYFQWQADRLPPAQAEQAESLRSRALANEQWAETGSLPHPFRRSRTRHFSFFHPSAREAAGSIARILANPAFNVERHVPSRAAMFAYMHDILGNPFRPVALDPTWRTEAVVGLATGIYTDHAFDRLPVLADALEDAGCADADVLAHCRGPGPHARGCWVVDLLLGKT